MKKPIMSAIALASVLAIETAVAETTGFLPIDGMDGIAIARFPVTNQDYSRFVKDTGHDAPRYWKGGDFPKGKERHPVLWVSYDDACAYCDWLCKKDAAHTYRLPTEGEWEAAAGETPTDAKFNYNGVVASHYLKENPKRLVTFVHPKSALNGKSMPLDEVISVSADGRHVRGWVNHRDYTGFIYTDLFKELGETGGYTTPVDAYPETKSACGALDMWGNCWEWTSTEIVAKNGAERGKTVNAIKGGSWYANRNSCFTSFRGEGRRPSGCYSTVGFRVVAVGKKTADKAEPFVRIAEIEVHPEWLDAYLEAARTVGAESVAKEPGVICIFPMQQRENPCVIRIVEIYRDEAAYKAHLQTPHFRAYKEGTPHMIKSLNLVPMSPLDPDGMKLIFRKKGINP